MMQVVAHLAELRQALQVAADLSMMTILLPTQGVWEVPVIYPFNRK